MGISEQQKTQISGLLSKKIEAKLKTYARESTSMPFLAALMQNKEQVAAYSFIHSMATTLGMSIYEELSKIVAGETADQCETKFKVSGKISRDQKSVIGDILRRLRNGELISDIDAETSEVLSASKENGMEQLEGKIADFFMIRQGVEHYFEIKTVKPNIDVFAASKSKLLEWVARKGNPVKVFVAFPYNPYYPEPYQRFTLQGMLTPGKDLLIGDEYWDFLGGKGTYEQLMGAVNDVGLIYKDRIAAKIKEVADTKLSI